MNALRILVIDDSPDDRMIYRRALARAGTYAITERHTGEDGLAQLERETPECVLLDYSLPGRDGVEVLRRLRASRPFLPVVMLTGQGSEALAVRAMQHGAQNYIGKHKVTPETLAHAIAMAIEHAGMQRRVAEQRASLEIFARALAHDLKEPVRSIRSFLDLIQAREPLSERAAQYFAYVQSAAERMNRLIDTVYLYTRLDVADGTPATEPCDCAEALGEARGNLNELIREHRAVITAGPLPVVQADRMQLMQLFQNLLSNAIRHGDEREPRIHVEARPHENGWQLRVCDNGPGVDQEARERIFEPFRRHSRPGDKGLGLGLAICRKLVDALGGTIGCEANEGGGACFAFTLPAGEKPAGVRLSFRAPASGERASVLLVEDNEADAELTRILLIEQGQMDCRLEVASRAGEALARLSRRNHGIDLVLLDINLPGMDGFDLLSRLGGGGPPVVMCSTSGDDGDRARARRLGAAGYITKPMNVSKLRPLLEGLSGLRLLDHSCGSVLMRETPIR